MIGAFILTGQLWAAVLGPPSGATGNVQEAPAAPLTISAAIAQARASSPRRRGAAHVADGARDATQYVSTLPNPTLELRTENWNSSRQPFAPDLDVLAVLTQPIELGGKRGLRRTLAAAEHDVARTALTSLERQIALDTAGAYVRALRARALVDTLSAFRDGLSTFVTSVSRRVAEGYSAEADLLKLKTEVARVDIDIARARLELQRGLAALGVVIGVVTPLHASQLVEPAPLSVPEADTATVAAGVARHPDVLAAAATVDRARQATAFERVRRLPDPAFVGGYKRTEGFDTIAFGVTIPVPLFDRNRAAVARAAGVERGAAADRDALERQLAADAVSLLHAARTLADRARSTSGELLEPAEVVRRAARTAYREGAADVLKLVDAERVYADVQRAAVDLRLEALLTTIEARFALGEETIP